MTTTAAWTHPLTTETLYKITSNTTDPQNRDEAMAEIERREECCSDCFAAMDDPDAPLPAVRRPRRRARRMSGGVRVMSVNRRDRERAVCPACGREVTVTRSGVLMAHRAFLPGTFQPGPKVCQPAAWTQR